MAIGTFSRYSSNMTYFTKHYFTEDVRNHSFLDQQDKAFPQLGWPPQDSFEILDYP